MSIVIHEKNKGREFRLIISNFLHLIDNFTAEFFPGKNPGAFNNALGLNRLIKWDKRKRKIDTYQLFTLSLFVTPVGIHLVTQNPTSIIAWFVLLWGTSCGVLLFWEKHASDEKRDEKISINTTDNDELKKENKKMKEKMKDLETKFNELSKKLDV